MACWGGIAIRNGQCDAGSNQHQHGGGQEGA